MLMLPKSRLGLLLAGGLLALSAGRADAEKLKVCATVPDLGSLVSEVGGDEVSVTVFGKGQEDPHFIEAKPSFIKATSEADMFIELGMEMEIGYAPLLLGNSRNARVLANGPGFVDASRAVAPMELAAGTVDRSMGDIHAAGNPHYLLDPINGLKVAALLRDKLIELRPQKKDYFDSRYGDFRKRLGIA